MDGKLLDPTQLQLRVISLDEVLLHEGHDAGRVERMVHLLQEEQMLRNPIIATEYEQDIVQLDGATRVMALRQMGIPHALVQLVRYEDPDVSIDTWNHVLINLPLSSIRDRLQQAVGVQGDSCDLSTFRDSLEQNEICFGLVSPEGDCTHFQREGSDLDDALLLNHVVDAYRGKADVHRTAQLDINALRDQFPGFTGVVAFPRMEPRDVMHFATNQVKLPMGITRHLVGGRALGFNISLEFLASYLPIEEKNDQVQTMVLDRIQRRKVRVYQEPTVVFDE